VAVGCQRLVPDGQGPGTMMRHRGRSDLRRPRKGKKPARGKIVQEEVEVQKATKRPQNGHAKENK
jgi:hypothetical protein